MQTKLLRVLQEKTFERVGSSESMQVDVRLVAATHQNLEQLIQQGRFREDLFYRLNVIALTVPPLRDRPEDVPELAQHFLESLCAPGPVKAVGPDRRRRGCCACGPIIGRATCGSWKTPSSGRSSSRTGRY